MAQRIAYFVTSVFFLDAPFCLRVRKSAYPAFEYYNFLANLESQQASSFEEQSDHFFKPVFLLCLMFTFSCFDASFFFSKGRGNENRVVVVI